MSSPIIEVLRQVKDQKKRKRMISNRESARRSRMRKQKHLDDLTTQVSQLMKENNCILGNLNVTTQMLLKIEGENLVLRARMAELTHRLNSLNEMLDCLNNSENHGVLFDGTDHQNVDAGHMMMSGDDFLNPWNMLYVNQTIMFDDLIHV